MARSWTRLWRVGALSLLGASMIAPIGRVSAQQDPPSAASPVTKPSKERFSSAMKRLREQRRAKAERKTQKEKAPRDAKSKTKGASEAISQRLTERESKREKRAKRKRDQEKNLQEKVDSKKAKRGKLELTDAEKPEKTSPAAARDTREPAVVKRAARRAAPPLPEPQYTELERALQRSLTLQVLDLGPGERWQVSLSNRGSSPLRIAADPRLLSFEAVVPGKNKPATCTLPDALLPRESRLRYRTLHPGQQFTFDVDPLMYCFESGDQTILVPGTFLTPAYGFGEKTKTRWSWGRAYQERLPQDAPFAAMPTREAPGPAPSAGEEPVAPEGAESEGNNSATDDDQNAALAPTPGASAGAEDDTGGLKRVVGEGFALRSEYQGWARARVHRETLDDRPGEGLRLSISQGSDAPSARDVTVTVKLENQSSEAQRVYFRRDLVSFIIEGPDGRHRCEAFSAALRAPDAQAFTSIAPGKSASFTTQLLEFCPAESFSRPGFYYVSAVLPSTARGAFPDEDVFTGKLAASKPRAVRLHRGELPYVVRRGGGGSGVEGGGGRFTRSPPNAIVPEGQMITPPAPAPEPPPEPPPPPPMD